MKNEINYKKIKDIRIAKGKGQKYLADTLHIVKSAYSKLESGKRIPRADELKTIADSLEIDINELFINEKKMLNKKDSASNAYDIKLNEVDFFEKMLYLFSTELEGYFHSKAMDAINSQVDSEPLSYDEYINNKGDWQSPKEAFNCIRKDIESYMNNGTQAHYYHSEAQIEFLKNIDDESLMELVKKKENFPFASAVIYWPHVYKEEGVKKVFNELFRNEPIFLLFLRFGLIQDHSLIYRWDKYWQEDGERPFNIGDFMPLKPIHKKINSKLKTVINRQRKIEIEKWKKMPPPKIKFDDNDDLPF